MNFSISTIYYTILKTEFQAFKLLEFNFYILACFLLFLKLTLVKVSIEAINRHVLVMVALLNDMPIAHDQDQVRIANSGQR